MAAPAQTCEGAISRANRDTRTTPSANQTLRSTRPGPFGAAAAPTRPDGTPSDLDLPVWPNEDLAMTDAAPPDRRRTWFVLTGPAVGVAIGILVSVTTDVPFAPEAGLLLGALAGWFWAARLRR